MADKMMRIAGRGEDGKAKAIASDNEGRLVTRNLEELSLFEGVKNIAQYARVRTRTIDSSGYSAGRLLLRIAGEREFQVKLIPINYLDAEEEGKIVFNGTANEKLVLEYELTTKFYQLEFYPVSSAVAVRPDSAIVHNNNITNVGTTYSRRPFKGTTIGRGERLDSDTLHSKGYLNARLTIGLAGLRNIRVSILDIDKSNVVDERVVYEGFADGNKVINYMLVLSDYKIAIEPLEEDVRISDRSVEILHNESIDRKDKKEEIIIKNRPESKKPIGNLIFKESGIGTIRRMATGIDGYFYVVDGSGKLKKYDDIVEGEALESGLTFDKGSLQKIIRLSDGFLFFCTTITDGVRATHIYRSDSIDGNLVEVYKNDNSKYDEDDHPSWSPNFGIDFYDNGTESIILAGEYGLGESSRSLILSTDGGRNFDIVKESVVGDANGSNSHWHDVAIDTYRGLLWASQGDNTNRGVYYSEDLGKTWETLTRNYQPTAIIPFPDTVVLGRDNGLVGFDVIEFPDLISDLSEESIGELRSFKKRSSAYYYANAPVVYNNEAYLSFTLYNNSVAPMLVATGDFGATWHGVWNGMSQNHVSHMIAIDENNVYVFRDNKVFYAEKTKWV